MTAMVDDGTGPAWLPLSFSCVGDFFSAIVAARQIEAAIQVAAHVRGMSDDELLAFGLREDDVDRLRRRSRAERPPKPIARYSVIGKVKPRHEAAE